MDIERDLIRRVLNGEQLAFAHLVRKYQQPLFRVIFRLVQSEQVAEEIVQEAFLKAYRNLSAFEGRSSFKSWLLQIGVNTAKNSLRTKRLDLVNIGDVKMSTKDRPSHNSEQLSVQEMVRSEIDMLPEKQRVAVELRIFEDLSFAEIAQLMNCPYDTAKANFRHGLLKLKARLSESQDMKDWFYEQGGPEVEFNGFQMEVEQ